MRKHILVVIVLNTYMILTYAEWKFSDIFTIKLGHFGAKLEVSNDLFELGLVDQGDEPAVDIDKWFTEGWLKNLEVKIKCVKKKPVYGFRPGGFFWNPHPAGNCVIFFSELNSEFPQPIYGKNAILNDHIIINKTFILTFTC